MQVLFCYSMAFVTPAT